MLKKLKSFYFGLFFLGLLGLCLSGCSSSKPAGGEGNNAMEASEGTGDESQLEEAKQAAESAEWEAHRLREELNRKKNANQ